MSEKNTKGRYPKNEIFQFVKDASAGTILEVHVSFRAEPIIPG